jgi:ankyrin repeat protein
VKLLLERGAKLETKDKDGQTPLSWAVSALELKGLLDLNLH